MRLWSLNPKYLDQKGLVAVWREALLAKAVLENKTQGYKNHPQLQRFKQAKNPVAAINTYLYHIYREAESRGYKFDVKKLSKAYTKQKLPITQGQLDYELSHLKKKLKQRDTQCYKNLTKAKTIEPNPLFFIVKGKVADWEKI